MIEADIEIINCLNPHVLDQYSQSIMLHGSQYFAFSAWPCSRHSKQMCFKALSQFHIGMNDGFSQISGALSLAPATQVAWTLLHEHKVEVFGYTAGVLKYKDIGLELPATYVRRLQSGEWKLWMYPAENIDGLVEAVQLNYIH